MFRILAKPASDSSGSSYASDFVILRLGYVLFAFVYRARELCVFLGKIKPSYLSFSLYSVEREGDHVLRSD